MFGASRWRVAGNYFREAGEVEEVTAKQLTFIASGGRTGTQYFGDLLSETVSDAYSEHEPDMVAGVSMLTVSRVVEFGLWNMIVGRLLGQTGVRIIGQRYLEGKIPKDVMHRKLRSLRNGYHKRIPQSLVIESYYAWWMVADQIGEIWPGAKVAGILRDPRDWMASWLRHESRRRNGALTERLPPGPLTPTGLGDTDAELQWASLDQVGRLAWEWGRIADTLDRAAEHSGNVAVFRFEDLFYGERTALADFVEFVSTHDHGPSHSIVDIDAMSRDVRNSSPGPRTSWQDWSDRQIAAVAHFCGNGMDRHGYGSEDEWRDRVRVANPLQAQKESLNGRIAAWRRCVRSE